MRRERGGLGGLDDLELGRTMLDVFIVPAILGGAPPVAAGLGDFGSCFACGLRPRTMLEVFMMG